MRIYTIIAGVNGTGKSSFAGSQRECHPDWGIMIDADLLNAKHGGDRIKGGKEAIGIISDCLEKGVNFTQETTLSGGRTLRTIKAAREKGYFIQLYYIGVSSAEESVSRIENRVRKGGHDIPREDVVRRFGKRFDDVMKVLPYCDRADFYDNENGFFKAGEYLCGRISITCGDPPEWLTELKRLHEK